MADTGIASSHNLTNIQWDNTLIAEYLDRLVYKKYIGTSSSSVIQVKENLKKGKGDKIRIPLRDALDGEGVTGNSTLEGNEEEMNYHDMEVLIDQIRNAVRLDGVMSEQRVAFDLREAARDGLTEWHAQTIETLITNTFSAIDGDTAYASASEATKDAWLVNQADRVVFGNASPGLADHSVDLALIDSTNDVLKPATVSLAKRKAKLANPRIRPIKLIGTGVELYVMFVHPYVFRDFAGQDVVKNAQRDSWPRLGESHPIFQGQNQVWWDGVLVVETPKILLLDGVGAASIDVAVNCLCGAQAVMFGVGGYRGGMRFKWVEKGFDYEEKTGFSAGQILGIEQSYFNDKMHGMVRVYASAVAD